MLEVAPFWQDVPGWVIFIGLSVLATIIGNRYDSRTEAFLDRMSGSTLSDEQKSFGVQAGNYRCLRNIQQTLMLLVFVIGYAVLFR